VRGVTTSQVTIDGRENCGRSGSARVKTDKHGGSVVKLISREKPGGRQSPEYNVGNQKSPGEPTQTRMCKQQPSPLGRVYCKTQEKKKHEGEQIK